MPRGMTIFMNAVYNGSIGLSNKSKENQVHGATYKKYLLKRTPRVNISW